MLRIASAGSIVFGVRGFIDTHICRAAGFGPEAVWVHTDHAHLLIERALDGALDADIVLLPAEMIETLQDMGVTLARNRVALGTVAIGAAVRTGSPVPSITTARLLGEALMAADEIALTLAPTGMHMMNVIGRLGLMPQLEARIRRFDKSAEVNAYIVAQTGNVLAFGPATEILAWRSKGVTWCGPVPSRFQVDLPCAAAMLARTDKANRAGEFLALLARQEARDCFADSGVGVAGT